MAKVAWWMSLFVALCNLVVVFSCLYAFFFMDKHSIMTALITFQFLSALQIFWLCWKLLFTIKIRGNDNDQDDDFQTNKVQDEKMKDNDDDYKANNVQEKKIPDEKTPDGQVDVQ